jgi:hypothetical protein
MRYKISFVCTSYYSFIDYLLREENLRQKIERASKVTSLSCGSWNEFWGVRWLSAWPQSSWIKNQISNVRWLKCVSGVFSICLFSVQRAPMIFNGFHIHICTHK